MSRFFALNMTRVCQTARPEDLRGLRRFRDSYPRAKAFFVYTGSRRRHDAGKDRAHGAQVPPGKAVQAGWLVMGVPAKPARKMSPDEREDVLRNASDDVELWRRDYGEGRSRAVV
jgi:hypothetical protein